MRQLVGVLLFTRLITAPSHVWADFEVAMISDSLIDSEALTIQGGFGQCINGLAFQQDVVVTHGEHQYVAYYDARRRVCLARRELPRGRWRIIRFGDYDVRSNDAHNTISMGICLKDGTMHLAFDHHGHPLHYRVSRKGAADNPRDATWDTSLFGPVVSQNEMLGDNYRWAEEGVLSIMVQQSPERAHQPTPLRILDFSLEQR